MPIVSCNLQLAYRLQQDIVSCKLQQENIVSEDMVFQDMVFQDMVSQVILSQDIVSCYLSHATCYLSHPTSYLSDATCYLSDATCSVRIDCIKTWYRVLQGPTTRHLVLQPPTCVSTATSSIRAGHSNHLYACEGPGMAQAARICKLQVHTHTNIQALRP